jgi:hypothetical protein
MIARRAALLLSVAAGLTACERPPVPGQPEEIATRADAVPAAVRDAAEAIGARLGGAHCTSWSWDREDLDWECTLVGLPRAAELDVSVEGRFLELELVHELAEVERALPEVAARIDDECGGRPGAFVELSLRLERHLDAIPELPAAWTMDGVVLEVQCPQGKDVEFDARNMARVRAVDDRPPQDGTAPAP